MRKCDISGRKLQFLAENVTFLGENHGISGRKRCVLGEKTGISGRYCHIVGETTGIFGRKFNISGGKVQFLGENVILREKTAVSEGKWPTSGRKLVFLVVQR